MDLPLWVKALGKLFQFGITVYESWTTEGFAPKELETLPALVDFLGELSGNKTGRSLDMEALHLGLITRCFGQAFGRHWAFNKSLAPKLGGFRIFMSKEERQRAQEIELRVKLATEMLEELGRIGDLPAGEEEWKRVGKLTGGPLSTPYYQALWSAFTNKNLDEDGTGTPPLLDLGETGRLEFERHFLLAYHQALSSQVGQPLQHYLERLSDGYRVQLLRELLLKDLAGWGGRHLFGNAERRAVRADDPIPFMPLGQMYVEPDARLSGDNKDARTPILQLVEQLLKNQRNVLILKADFGMGKSLTARTLALRWAQRYLSGRDPSPEAILPIYIRCADDLPDEGFDLEQTVRGAWKRQAEALELKLKVGDEALRPPGKNERAIFLLDGLDEVILGERRLESFFRRIREEASDRHTFIILSRPGALPAERDLKDIPVIELLPWEPEQSEEWLERWRRIRHEGPAWPQLKERGLLEFASTPILLFMVTQTWGRYSAQAGASLAALYEEFFWQIAQGKHEADCERHPNVAEASSELREHLIEKRLLSREATNPEAMLWLMGRVAWEATKLEQRQMLEPLRKAEALTKRDIENLIVGELAVERNASDTIDAIQVGLLLTMQAHLRAGTASQLLFGHKSFREYLVARYWADRLKALAQARQRQWEELEKPLLGGRLLSQEDSTFDFLMQMLNGTPLVEHPRSPFGLGDDGRDALLEWAQNRFESEEQQDSSGNRAPTVRDDRRPWLREAALAIGSRLRGSPGLRLRDKLTIRSMLTWFWLMRVGPIVIARGLRGRDALLSELTLRGADFAEAELDGASLLNADLEPGGFEHPACSFMGAELNKANLSGARLSLCLFNEASLIGANLVNTALIGASFARAKLMRADLHGARLTGAVLYKADLSSAILERALLDSADLQGAQLIGTSLIGASLIGANLTGAVLTDAVLQHARYDETTRWPDGFDPRAAGATYEEP